MKVASVPRPSPARELPAKRHLAGMLKPKLLAAALLCAHAHAIA
jgi:hypothetical protein